MSGIIEKRQVKSKLELLEGFRKTPIVQVVCQKLGVARATYYRWRTKDEKFADDADRALEAGSLLVNDMAESQLLTAIREQNMTAIIFWLKHHHPNYSTRVELSGQIRHEYKLSEDEERLIERALIAVSREED